MFDKNSILAQAWARQIQEGAVTFEDVPALFNLRDVVSDLLDNHEEAETNV